MDEREFEAWAKSTFGFWIDDDPPRVLSYVDGGCHPASTEEIAMWDALQAARRTTPDREAWISVDEKLPACDRKDGTMGVEVLIYPAMETGERTAFFGRRISQKPMFYRYGAPVHGVTHWMPLPAAPTSDQGEKS